MAAPTRVLTNLASVQSFAFPSNWVPRFSEAYRLQMQAWVDASEGGQSVGASAWDGYLTTAIAERIVEGMSATNSIALSFPPRPAL
jgi:myo-inositol 2-dehydrogenase / D-chiro-inositol 1-dehydrogenase